MDSARHVIKRILNTRLFESCIPSYDVASTIHQSLAPGSEQATHCTPSELVTKAATAAMAAMPSAPLVHTIQPSVVAKAFVMVRWCRLTQN
jgi:hypothetical protein